MADGGGLPDRRAAMLAGVTTYAPEVAWAICARIAAGESIMAVCKSPGMPHRTTVRNWADARPEFAVALASAQRARRVAARMADRALAAQKRARPALPKASRQSTYTPQVGELIFRRLANGESVISIARDPEMPCAGTIYAWTRRHPEFEATYELGRSLQADYLADEVREVALDCTPATVSADRLRFDALRWLTARLAPKKYMDRLMVGHAVRLAAEADAEAAELEARRTPGNPRGLPTMHVSVSRFDTLDREVFAIPPRCSFDEWAYEQKHGRPYDGPEPLTPEERAEGDAAWAERRRQYGRPPWRPPEDWRPVTR